MKSNKTKKKSARSSSGKKGEQPRVKSNKPTKKSAESSNKLKQPNVKGNGVGAKEVGVEVQAEAGQVENPNLRKVLENIRELQWSGNVRSAEDFYGIGEEVQKVEDDPKKYGLKPDQTAVKFLAEKLGCQKDTLYNAVKVVRRWQKKVFCQWLKKVGPKGRTLSFAHFVAIAAIDDPNKREEMLEKALAKNMTTRALLREVGGLEPKRAKAKSKSAQPPPLVGLIAATEGALGEWQNIDEALADDDADALRLLDRSSEVQHQLSKMCLENSRALARRRDAVAASGSVGALALGSAPDGAPLQPVVLSASNPHAPAVRQLCSTNPNAEPATPKVSRKRRKLPISEGASMPSANTNSDPAQLGAGGPVPGAEQAPGDVAGVLS